ncbi:MAG TPA: translation initiation factor IF-2 [Pirellulales bacterium]|nr:translation initiation factor IF-2 [Pirellulales bacterium]
MSVRIYALAKELGIDSKECVDLCAKAGVTGKGSALASLTDDEETKVRSFIAGGASKGPARAAPSAAKPGAPTLPPPESAPMSREAYIPPGGTSGKPPVIPSKPTLPPKPERVDRPVVETPKKPAAEAPKGPVIRVAPLPTAQQPPPPKKPAEPAPQKPVIKLPADVRSGRAPLAARIKEREEQRVDSAQAPAAKKPGEPRAPAAKGPLAMPDSSRPRRGGGVGAGGGGGGGKVAAKSEDSQMGTREERQRNRKRTTGDRPLRVSATGVVEEERTFRRPKPRQKRSGVSTAAPRKGHVVIQLPCNVRSFSASIGVNVPKVLQKLLQLGIMSNITSQLEADTIELLAVEFGAEVEVREAYDIEDQLITSLQAEQDDPDQLEPRPPIVTFLGHVDHGKTSLLDRIIGTNVAAGERGGITQHIRAYRVERDGRAIAFVDTPGHEAFTQMRARGANVTDIAVLVVAADDGVMPQTEEAISHARAANVPIVVALNKMDLYGVNIDRIMQQLAANELLPADWGGTTEVVKCSALTGQGVDELLDTLLTIAELHEYQANPHRHAYGTCLESEVDEERGVVAKLLVQKGTLKVGDVLFCGSAYGRVKAMYDTLDPRRTHTEAGPSTPVNVTGLNEAPGAGQHFYVLDDIGDARDIAEQRTTQSRQVALSGQTAHVTLETLHERLGGEEVQTLNIILRADTQGSIEAIVKEFGKLQHPEVQLKILQKMVGGITEADVHLADASDAIIIGFNVVPDEGARALADEAGVQVRRYDIIYQVTDDIRKALEGMLKPEKRDVDLGRALVQRTFLISRLGTIAGCRVLSGTIERNCRVRVIRENRVLGDYALESLKREKDDTREVREGLECGMKLRGFNDLKEGDVLECYRVEEFARTL